MAQIPILKLTPSSELVFETTEPGCHTVLSLKNITDVPVAYKVRSKQIKTTSPKSYLVKPSLGFLVPLEEVNVSFTLLVPIDLVGFKHKFLVMSAKCKGVTQTSSVEDIRRAYEEAWGKDVFQIKLDVKVMVRPM